MKRPMLVFTAMLATAFLVGAMSADAAKQPGSTDGSATAVELASKKGCKKKGGKKGTSPKSTYKAKGGKKKSCKKGKKGGKKKPGKPKPKPKPPKPPSLNGDFTLKGAFGNEPGATVEMTVTIKNSAPTKVSGIKVSNIAYKCVGGGAQNTGNERRSFAVPGSFTKITEAAGGGIWSVEGEVEQGLSSYEVHFLLRNYGKTALPAGGPPARYKWRDEAADADCATTDDWGDWEANAPGA